LDGTEYILSILDRSCGIVFYINLHFSFDGINSIIVEGMEIQF
jgi:hypothetical protein